MRRVVHKYIFLFRFYARVKYNTDNAPSGTYIERLFSVRGQFLQDDEIRFQKKVPKRLRF